MLDKSGEDLANLCSSSKYSKESVEYTNNVIDD